MRNQALGARGVQNIRTLILKHNLTTRVLDHTIPIKSENQLMLGYYSSID